MRVNVSPQTSSGLAWLPVAALLLLVLVQNCFGAYFTGITYDELTHLTYGQRWLTRDADQRGGSQNPVFAIHAASERLGNFLSALTTDRTPAHFQSRKVAARLPTVFFSVVLGLYIYQWSKRLYGSLAGLFSLFLFTFEPNLQAHSQLVTHDVFAVGTITLSTYYFWRYLQNGRVRTLILMVLFVSVSQLTKYTCLFLYPIFLIIAAVKYSSLFWRSLVEFQIIRFWRMLTTFLKIAGIILFAGLFIINAGFFFQRTYLSLEQYRLESKLLTGLCSALHLSNKVPVPLPHAYINGFDCVETMCENSSGCGNIYLLGKLEISRPFRGFCCYYWIASLFKVPCAILFFVFAAFFLYFKKRSFLRTFFTREIFLFVPVIVFSVYFNFFFRENVGLRYFLVSFPFFLIFCGYLMRYWNNYSRTIKCGILGLCVYLVVSSFSYYPYYLSYFNELVPDRKQAYKILADSNLDWGQCRNEAQIYASRHPNVFLNPGAPVAGKILVSVNDLVGVIDPYKYRWLRDHFSPSGHVGYSWLLFNVSKDDLKKLVRG